MQEDRLPFSFFENCDTLALARKLIGCKLVHDSPDGRTSGIIVETEAYLRDDPACHAYNKRTARTEPMYGPAGTIYVYLIYGMYECVNVVSNEAGIGEAVLIRALQPTEGPELMEHRRNLKREVAGKTGRKIKPKDLCNGPGKLVVSMGISRNAHNNQRFPDSDLYISGPGSGHFDIVATTRIGINVGKDLPYRFLIKDNIFVSG